MHLVSYFHFFAFISYGYLAIYIFGKNPGSRLNQSCAGFIACLAIWSFQNTILHSPWTSLETMMNLMNNAFKAMPDGGSITISTRNRYVDLPIAGYEDVIQGDYVVLMVKKDEGIGISQTERVKQTLDLGASAYLRKPYTLEKIGLAVRTAPYTDS